MTTYKSSGVDIEKADQLVKRLREKAPDIGGFGGLFPIGSRLAGLKGFDKYSNRKPMLSPTLVASTDGVGTKLLVAEMTGEHKTMGIDLVAMVVNDISACGAKPLFFLDYLATGKLDIARTEEILEGIIEGCRRADCTLLGGETAELPGLYENGKYDLAGFGVGIVEGKCIVDGYNIKPGDIMIGIGSSGLHSNGFSLARKVLLQKAKLSLEKKHPELGEPLGRVLMRPTHIYSPLICALTKRMPIKGIAHITGGGIPGNLSRILPKKIDAEIDTDAWPPQPIFDLISETGPVSREEMFKTFNMGIGMIIVVSSEKRKVVHKYCEKFNFPSYDIGQTISGEGRVHLT